VILSDGIFNLALLGAPKGAKTGLRYLGFAAARSILLGYREDFDAIGEEKEYYEKGSLRKERKDVDK